MRTPRTPGVAPPPNSRAAINTQHSPKKPNNSLNCLAAYGGTLEASILRDLKQGLKGREKRYRVEN